MAAAAIKIANRTDRNNADAHPFWRLGRLDRPLFGDLTMRCPHAPPPEASGSEDEIYLAVCELIRAHAALEIFTKP